ncbi:MAG: hypothetical protein WC785_01655 [Tatlockia sp.]|jgi:hypothetical protein
MNKRETIEEQLIRMSNNTTQVLRNMQDQVVQTYRLRVLSQLFRLFFFEKPVKIEKFISFLKENWEQVKGTLLGYTALPHDEVTLLLCDIAEWVAYEKNLSLLPEQKPFSALEFLMPGMHAKSLDISYPHLLPYKNNKRCWQNPCICLKEIIRTHILSENRLYLIPVILINRLETLFSPGKLHNPYYDYSLPEPNFPFITRSEYERLITHSSFTTAVHESLEQYHRVSSDKSTLLGHLKALTSALYFNGFATGIGEETNAGSGTYHAIILFNEFYKHLDAAIPAPLKREIDLLIAFSSDPLKNKNATETIQTCISSRREQLDLLIEKYLFELNEITLSDGKKSQLLHQSQTALQASQLQLNSEINKTEHLDVTVKDMASLTQNTLKWLKIRLEITSLSDVELLAAMKPSEINALCQDIEITMQITAQFRQLESLVLFFLETKPASLNALLPFLAPHLCRRHLINRDSLKQLMIPQDTERLMLLCQHFKPFIPDLFKNISDLALLRELLSPAQRGVVLWEFKEQLFSIIKDEHFLWSTFKRSASEERTVLLEIFRDAFPKISEFSLFNSQFREGNSPRIPNAAIKDAESLGLFFTVLSDAHFERVLNDYLQEFSPLIKNTEDLHALLSTLSPQKTQITLTYFADRITTAFDIALLIRLPLGQFSLVLDTIKKRFAAIFSLEEYRSVEIETCFDFLPFREYVKIYDETRQENLYLLWTVLQEQKMLFIESLEAFCAFKPYVPVRAIVDFCAQHNAFFCASLKELSHFRQLAFKVTPDQRIKLFLLAKETVANLVHTYADFESLICLFDQADKAFLFDFFIERMEALVSNSQSLSALLHHFNTDKEYVRVIFETLRHKLPSLLAIKEDINLFLFYEQKDQVETILSALSPIFPESINSSYKLSWWFSVFPAHKALIFEAMKRHIPALIQTPRGLESLASFLKKEQFIEFCQIRADSLILGPEKRLTIANALNQEKLDLEVIYRLLDFKKPLAQSLGGSVFAPGVRLLKSLRERSTLTP